MSRYPTSAELAAFRRSIAPSGMDLDSLRWLDERGHGIGYRIPLQDHDSGVLSMARREADASRSRAYATKGMASQWLVPVHPKSGGAWYAERVDGAPYQWHTYGRRDGIVASDTWSEDDAPRSPLPVRYQPSFIITR